MDSQGHLPPHNLGLYRLRHFVGRSEELARLAQWIDHYPVVAISGPSGVGKSTLATKLAIQEANRFDEGILWTGAPGDTDFDFYDIVRGLEDVLSTGITRQPVDLWPPLVLQQLYGANRLLVLDEMTEVDEPTVDKIMTIIGQIKPGGRGRFVLLGRKLPSRLLDAAGKAHLVLGGLDRGAVEAWIGHKQQTYPITHHDAPQLHRLTGGHPLAMQLAAGLWDSRDWQQLIDLVSSQPPQDWEARLQAIVVAALATLAQKFPAANRLLQDLTYSSGGFDLAAVNHLCFSEGQATPGCQTDLTTLLQRGLLMHNPDEARFFIHPLIRRHLDLTGSQIQIELAPAHAAYYLALAQPYEDRPPEAWHPLDKEWGNIRKALNFLVDALESALERPVEAILAAVDDLPPLDLPPDMEETTCLIKDYAIALRAYIVTRHPPEGYRWLAAGVIAARHHQDAAAEAVLGNRLATIAQSHRDYQTARTWYRHSLSHFRASGDWLRVVRTLKNLGLTQNMLGNPTAALDAYYEALQLVQQHNRYDEQAAIQVRIGWIHHELNDFEEAVRWYRRALAIDESHHGHPRWRAAHHNRIGLALEGNEQYDEALSCYHRAVALFDLADNKEGLSSAYGNLGAIHYKLGQPTEALKWYEQDLAIVDQLGNWFDRAAILHNMGHIALEMDEYRAALDYFVASRNIYRQFGQDTLTKEEQLLIDTIHDRHITFG